MNENLDDSSFGLISNSLSRVSKRKLLSCAIAISLLIAVTPYLQLQTVAARPNFDFNSVGLECQRQWDGLDQLIEEGRRTHYAGDWKARYQAALNEWYGFCAKYYGNYIVPRSVAIGPGGIIIGPISGGMLEDPRMEGPNNYGFPQYASTWEDETEITNQTGNQTGNQSSMGGQP